MKQTPKNIKKTLKQSIQNLAQSPQLFFSNPSKDFTRNRKLSFEQTVTSILSMSGGTLSNELMDFFDFKKNTPSVSALVQQRSKISSLAFETLFHSFTNSFTQQKLYRGYRLLAVDGSDIHIPTNKDELASFYPGRNSQKPYNLLHLNAMYDLCRRIYVDAIVQNSKESNEHKAFINMVDRDNSAYPTIYLADRGYESYNNLAHVQEKCANFLIRIKDLDRCGIATGLKLPDTEEFDVDLTLKLTRKKSAENRKQGLNYVHHKATFDYLPTHSEKSVPIEPYVLYLRLVRIKITDDTYEMLITNLDSTHFTSVELKELYAMRWGIETSFRDLKYTVGLICFHSKKAEYILQEIFAKLTMYNFAQLITSQVIIKQKHKKYAYKANFSAVVHICRNYLLKNISPPEIEALIQMHIVPIRPSTSNARKINSKMSLSFLYRIA